MSEVKVCRICLRTEALMYHFNRYQLKFYYEEVMALRVNADDGLPHHFCYECATILHKFHKFKEKCYSGQKVLKELLWKGPITYESIYKVDREEAMLISPLKIITDSKNIKTYVTQDSREMIQHNRPDNSVKNNDYCKITTEFRADVDVSNKKSPIIEVIEVNRQIADGMMNNDKRMIIAEQRTVGEQTNELQENIVVEIDFNEMMSDDEEMINNIDNENDAHSPNVVYVDKDSDIINIKEEMNDKRKKTFYPGLKIHSLDAKNWKTSDLSESEALTEFRARAEDSKYMKAAHKCTDCFKGFSQNEMLARHRLIRHAESLGPHECRFCRSRYRLECYLRRHMKEHYVKYECLRCHLVCQLQSTALLHEEYHSGVTRKCVYCNEEFRHISTYYTHLRTHRSEHVCTLCGASFVSALGLRQHKNIKHIALDVESPDDDEQVNTHCERCDIRFETRKAYEQHLFHSALHFNDKQADSDGMMAPKKVLGKKEKAKILKGNRKRSDDDEIKLINGRRSLKRHKRKAIPTTCHQCGQQFSTQQACWRHHLAEHPRTSFFAPNDRYICEICGSSLAPGSVATHQNIHTRERLHTCDTCGKQFHSTIGLKRHRVTHTGEKPYACPLCDKRFTQSNSMKLHYRTFHLKQPYPKRNRRQKPVPKGTPEAEASTSDSDSEDSLPDAEPKLSAPGPGVEPVPHVVPDRDNEESMHYLTLT